MWYIEVKHSGDKPTSLFECKEEGEAVARYATECSIQAKYRSFMPGATVVQMFYKPGNLDRQNKKKTEIISS